MGLLAKIQTATTPERDYTWVGEELEKLFQEANQEQVEQWVEEQDWFRPSSLTYKWGAGMCPRYWWYIFNHRPRFEKIETGNIARMEKGTHRHEVLQTKFEKFESFVENERELSMENPTLQGSCDTVLWVDGEEIIAEIKTTKQETWFKRQLEGPPHYNVIQLCLYLELAGLVRGFLLIENNNTMEVLLFPVEYTPALRAEIAELLEWMRKLEALIKEEKKLPERCFTKGSYNCKGCPFKKECWDGPDGDTAYPRSPAYEEVK